MRSALSNPWLVLVITVAALWDSWRWYVARVAHTPEEAITLVVTVGLVVAAGIKGRCTREGACGHVLLAAILSLALYSAARTAGAPAIVIAAIAVVGVLDVVYRVAFGKNPPPALYCLAALSLPVLPSLEFVLGYPMRVVSAALSVAALELQGLSVSREGTLLVFAGERVEFDAPCSGVKMLWAGLLLTLAVCTVWRSSARVTIAALAASLALTIAANVLRATSLFLVETGIVPGAAPWWHEGIGLIAFAVSSLATMQVLVWLNGSEAGLCRK